MKTWEIILGIAGIAVIVAGVLTPSSAPNPVDLTTSLPGKQITQTCAASFWEGILLPSKKLPYVFGAEKGSTYKNYGVGSWRVQNNQLIVNAYEEDKRINLVSQINPDTKESYLAEVIEGKDGREIAGIDSCGIEVNEAKGSNTKLFITRFKDFDAKIQEELIAQFGLCFDQLFAEWCE